MLKVVGKGLWNVVKRAVTKDGGSLLTLTNESNKFDRVATGALVVRFGLAVVILWIAHKSGFTVEQIIAVAKQLSEAS